MPRNKKGYNDNHTHHSKPLKRHTQARTFVDKQDQQQHLAKFLIQKENKQNKAQAEQKKVLEKEKKQAESIQELAKLLSTLTIFKRSIRPYRSSGVFVPNYDRIMKENNQSHIERNPIHNEEQSINKRPEL